MAEKEERPTRALSARRQLPRLSQLQGEIDRLWDSVWGPRLFRPFRFLEREEWLPAVDVYQQDGTVHLEAELPGMAEEDIEITVAELTVRGERKEEKEVKEEDYYRCERSRGRFLRQVALPAGVNADKAKASFKDGVLHVELPLKEAARQKKIEITASG